MFSQIWRTAFGVSGGVFHKIIACAGVKRLQINAISSIWRSWIHTRTHSMVNENIGLHRTKIDSRLCLQHYAAKTLNAANQNKVFNEFRTSVCVCVIIIDILIRFFVWFRRRINVTFYELWRMAKIYCVKAYIKRIWLAKCSDDETMHKQHVTSNQRIDSMTNITNSFQYFQQTFN